MKKEYMEPQMEVIEMLPEGMLCVSGDINGEATDPAHARMFGFEDDDFEDEE